MKNNFKIAGMMLILVIAGSMALSAQRQVRGEKIDTIRMDRRDLAPRTVMGMPLENSRVPGAQIPGRQIRHGWNDFNGPRNGMGQGRGFRHPGMGMGIGMGQPGQGRQGRMPDLYNIPNLTDKQKKDIADLRGKQMADVEKLRIDMQSKMKELRDSHRAKVMSLLTEEQKKWFEENNPKPDVVK
jgi:Spy/CpxP family protein refolding chaperone